MGKGDKRQLKEKELWVRMETLEKEKLINQP